MTTRTSSSTPLTILLLALLGLAPVGCTYHYTTTAPAQPAVASSGDGYVQHEVHYRDAHPVHAVDAELEDWCDVAGPHAHHYEPEHADFYVVDSDGYYMFNGDPTYYVVEEDVVAVELYSYHDHHPFVIDGTWCYIAGLHYHHYEPIWYHRYAWSNHAWYYHGHYDLWYRSGYTVHLGHYYGRHTSRRVSWHHRHGRTRTVATGSKRRHKGSSDRGGTVAAARPDGVSASPDSSGAGTVAAPRASGGGTGTTDSGSPSRGAARAGAQTASRSSQTATTTRDRAADQPLDAQRRPSVRDDLVTSLPRRKVTQPSERASDLRRSGVEIVEPAPSTAAAASRRQGLEAAPAERHELRSNLEPRTRRTSDLPRATETSRDRDRTTSRRAAEPDRRATTRSTTEPTRIDSDTTTSSRRRTRTTRDRQERATSRTTKPRRDTTRTTKPRRSETRTTTPRRDRSSSTTSRRSSSKKEKASSSSSRRRSSSTSSKSSSSRRRSSGSSSSSKKKSRSKKSASKKRSKARARSSKRSASPRRSTKSSRRRR